MSQEKPQVQSKYPIQIGKCHIVYTDHIEWKLRVTDFRNRRKKRDNAAFKLISDLRNISQAKFMKSGIPTTQPTDTEIKIMYTNIAYNTKTATK